MKIEEIPFKKADLGRIAQVVLEARQAVGYWNSDMEVGRVEDILSETFQNLRVRLISVETDNRINGLILLKVNDDNTAEINPWFLGGLPIVSPSIIDSDRLSSAMLEKVLQSAKSLNVTRLESFFSQDVHTVHTRTMFENHNMTLVEEIEHLRSPLNELTISVPDLPVEFHVEELSKIDRTQLYDCWYKAFLTGEDRSFQSRSEEERRGFFEEVFDLSREWTDEASLAFVDEKNPIAFAFVRPTHGRSNAHLWEFGVHPDYRRRGLARRLLKRVCEKLNEIGFQSFSVNVDVSNSAAYNLYRSLGLKREWGMVCYAWKSKD